MLSLDKQVIRNFYLFPAFFSSIFFGIDCKNLVVFSALSNYFIFNFSSNNKNLVAFIFVQILKWFWSSFLIWLKKEESKVWNDIFVDFALFNYKFIEHSRGKNLENLKNHQKLVWQIKVQKSLTKLMIRLYKYNLKYNSNSTTVVNHIEIKKLHSRV